MTPPIVTVSQTAVAVLAAATSIWLSLFVLSGAGVHGRPLPLLPAIGEGAGTVVAPFQAPARRPAATPSRRPASSLRVVARPATPAGPADPPRRETQRAHPVVRTSSSAPVEAAAATQVSAAPPAVAQQPTGLALGKAKARGHSKAAAAFVGVGARGRGQGKANGHSAEHHWGAPPGHGKSASAAPPVPPQPTGNHGGEGHGGGKQ
jgi:hypothetical protein